MGNWVVPARKGTNVNRLGANSRDLKSGTCNTMIALAGHECIRAQRVRSVSCVFKNSDSYVIGARIKITAVCPFNFPYYA